MQHQNVFRTLYLVVFSHLLVHSNACLKRVIVFQITTARSDPQETPLVSNLRCDNDTPLTLQKADQVSDVEASEFTHLKWNYPARFPKLFYIFIEYVNKDGCLQKEICMTDAVM